MKYYKNCLGTFPKLIKYRSICENFSDRMGRFKFTRDGGILTEEQRRFYEDNGYIVIQNNVNHALLDEIRQRFIDVCEGKITVGLTPIVKDPSLKRKGVKGEYLVNKVQDFLYDDVFFKYCTDPAIIDTVSSIVGPNITAAHSMVINKPPDADPRASLHPIHQDLFYFTFRPSEGIVASWTAMERSDEDNGCLYAVPGTHKGKLYPHSYPESYKHEVYHGIQGMDHLPKVYLVMEKGDTVFFHPLLLHGSGPNTTKGFRKAICCHFVDSNCHFIDVKGTIQERVITEVDEVLKRKGYPFGFVDLIKIGSRIVTGAPGKFQNLDSHF